MLLSEKGETQTERKINRELDKKCVNRQERLLLKSVVIIIVVTNFL